MADIICSKCGAKWSDSDPQVAIYTARLFSTPNNPIGTYLSVGQIIASGEAMLSCPKDPQPLLDAAISAKGQGPKSSARITGRRDPFRRG